jgi:zinc transport system ATP-binding protein
MTPPLVSVRHLTVELGGNIILRDLDAEIARGKITALIGKNGSGKTTFLRTLLGEIPFRGTIEFHCGHDHSQPEPKHVGYVPQKLQIDAKLPLTVRDLLALAIQRRPIFLGLTRRTQQTLHAILDSVQAPHALLDRPVEKISGGELQRVLLGLAIQPCPELLLLDEPAAGIDFQSMEAFNQTIVRLNREKGVTIVLVSHDLSVVSRHADEVLCLEGGAIKCHGAPREILTHETLSQTFGSDMSVFLHHHN